MATVGLPSAIALVGLLLTSAVLLRVKLDRRDAPWWRGLIAGIFSSPFTIGIPLFAFSFAVV